MLLIILIAWRACGCVSSDFWQLLNDSPSLMHYSLSFLSQGKTIIMIITIKAIVLLTAAQKLFVINFKKLRVKLPTLVRLCLIRVEIFNASISI